VTFGWIWKGDARPPFAEEPGPGQRSVWDFPRPPRIEEVGDRVVVEHAGVVIADTERAVRVLETASAPTYYIPPEDVRTELLGDTAAISVCEWKGTAVYHDLVLEGGEVPKAAWSYPNPNPAFDSIRNWLAFYASRLDICTVGDEEVRPQPGGFYGGWVTSDLVGPIKGEPGSSGW
jgi:uncharacterized protein (DUF427 family)